MSSMLIPLALMLLRCCSFWQRFLSELREAHTPILISDCTYYSMLYIVFLPGLDRPLVTSEAACLHIKQEEELVITVNTKGGWLSKTKWFCFRLDFTLIFFRFSCPEHNRAATSGDYIEGPRADCMVVAVKRMKAKELQLKGAQNAQSTRERKKKRFS